MTLELQVALRILRTWQLCQPHPSPGEKQLPSLLSPEVSKETEQPPRTGYQWQPRPSPDSLVTSASCMHTWATCAGKWGREEEGALPPGSFVLPDL